MKEHKDYDTDYMYLTDNGKFVCGACNSKYDTEEDVHKHWQGLK